MKICFRRRYAFNTRPSFFPIDTKGKPMFDSHFLIGKITRFFAIVKNRRLLIQTHDIPDPDAIASAEAFRVMARHFGINAVIVSNGFPQRRENRTLIRECMITLKPLETVRIKNPERYAWAFIDCLPGGGNVTIHPLAPGDVFMAIDHHGRPKTALKYDPGDFLIEEPEAGATATLLGEILIEMGIPISPRLASAMSYAIISDTQDFSRGASKTDLEVYAAIFPHTDQTIIASIRNARKSRRHFRTVHRCLEHTNVYRQLAWTWLGEVESGEIVAEMADFILGLETIEWALALGYTKERMFLSMRAAAQSGSCADMIRKLVPFSPFTVGGHDRFAGGFIPVDRTEDIEEMADFLIERFIRQTLKLPSSQAVPRGTPLIRLEKTPCAEQHENGS